jgi:hypothetical protein
MKYILATRMGIFINRSEDPSYIGRRDYVK